MKNNNNPLGVNQQEKIKNEQNKILTLVPEKIYKNEDTDKLDIFKENKGKSGIYRWVNKDSGKSYVGSATNLGKRLYNYYNTKYLMRNDYMIISRALLKCGYSNFILEILEYCEPSNVIAREQFYLDFLKPEYNILVKAGSSLGFKHLLETKARMSEARKGKTHSEETKAKLSGAALGRKLSEETIAKMSEAHTGKIRSEETKSKISEAMRGKKNPLFGKTPTEETKTKIREANGIAIEVFDMKTEETSVYASIRQAAKVLGCNETTVRRYLKSQKLYEGRYLFAKP